MPPKPHVSVVINHISDFGKILKESLPSEIHLAKNVTSQLKNNAALRTQVKDLMANEVAVVPASVGRNKNIFVPAPKQLPNHFSKPGTGYRLSEVKTKTLTKPLYSTTRPRPLRGLVTTVFGAAGFLGFQVAAELAKLGATVICPVRRTPLGSDPWGYSDIRHLRMIGDQGQSFPVVFDATNFEEVCKMVERSQMVFNCMGSWYLNKNRTDFYGPEGTFSNLPRSIARACQISGVQRFVHVSHVLADSASDIDFWKYKGMGEKAVMEEFPNSIIIRPTDMFGRKDRFTSYMAGNMTFANWPTPDRTSFLLKGKEYVQSQPVWVTDVARGMVRAATREQSFGEIFELGGPKAFHLLQLMRYVESVTRIQPFDLQLVSPAEAKLRFERPMYEPHKSWMDLHLRNDVLPTGAHKSWADLDIEPSSLKELEDVAPDWLAPHDTYATYENQVGLEARYMNVFTRGDSNFPYAILGFLGGGFGFIGYSLS